MKEKKAAGSGSWFGVEKDYFGPNAQSIAPRETPGGTDRQKIRIKSPANASRPTPS